jgi:hypothetical protein
MNKPQPPPVMVPSPIVPQQIPCPQCRKSVFDGDVIHNRIIKINEHGQAVAKCRCTTWVPLPLYFCQPVGD